MNLNDVPATAVTLADLWRMFYPQYEWRMNGDRCEYKSHTRLDWLELKRSERVERGFAAWLADGAPEFNQSRLSMRNHDRWQGYIY